MQSGKIFRAITYDGKIKENLNPAQINRIYKKLAYKAKIEYAIIQSISGHSMRIGAAKDLMLSGAELPLIMNRGRWSKIDTALRYIT